jgi:hypothetical protein
LLCFECFFSFRFAEKSFQSTKILPSNRQKKEFSPDINAMKKKILLLVYAVWLLPLFGNTQESAQDTSYWMRTAGLGFDFAQLLQINPRQGAGQNRLGMAGAVKFSIAYKKNKIAWDNSVLWQFGLQRLGAGVISTGGTTQKIPFQKSIDELRANTKVGYSIAENNRVFLALDFSLLSQLTPTYLGNAQFPGNFLSDIAGSGANSRFFAPATMTLSAGIDFKPSPKLSIFYTPLGGKFIVVADDRIAQLGVHGNPVARDGLGNVIDFKSTFTGLGSLVRIQYNSKFLEDRLALASNLALFSNYLDNPQNVDLDWTNQLDFSIFKGLQVTVLLNLFYDHDVLVQITDPNAPNGISGLGRRLSLTQQFLIKYAAVF